ncbi:MAG: 4Fe-4S binding protein [Thermodesulfobacteriota bacterium]|nr:4Fe-4S binding protein [Thermodesulfobacteriota bacterium]
MIIDRELCVGCGECEFTCTVGAIRQKSDKANIGRAGADTTAQGDDYHEIMACKEFNGFVSVFTDKKKATQVLKELKKRDAGFLMFPEQLKN